MFRTKEKILGDAGTEFAKAEALVDIRDVPVELEKAVQSLASQTERIADQNAGYDRRGNAKDL